MSNATNGEVCYCITTHHLLIDQQNIQHDTKVNGKVEAEAKLGGQKVNFKG